MSLVQKLLGAGLRPHVRRKARGKGLEDVSVALQTTLDEVLLPRIERVGDTPGNREALNHWIGIERWSLARVKVAQGEPFQEGSYRPFRMPEVTAWPELKAGFVQARAETLALARALQQSGHDPELTVRHNDLGPLTVVEWFVYINDHSRREVIRLR